MEENLVISKNNFGKTFYKTWIYLVFYSFIGFLLETLFGLFSKGVIESRQSFLFGPFCAIYGIGATLMIVFLGKMKGKPVLTFFLGAVIGATTEYLMSYFCEVFLHFEWWDYTGYFLNINGRTCLYFAVLWGILAIALIEYVNPFFNKVLNKISESKYYKLVKILFNIVMIILVIDIILTVVALRVFYLKIDEDFNVSNNLSGYNISRLYYTADKELDLISEEYMLKIYPNMRVIDYKDNKIYIDSLYKGIKTYYIKIFEK